VFGMSFGEFAVLLLVAMVVLGPKELPRYLRKAGQFVGHARDWAYDLRRKSGIDEVLRMEGIDKDLKDLAELRKFTRGEIAGLMGAVRSVANGVAPQALGPYAQAQTTAPAPPPPQLPPVVTVDPDREYPIDGADAYGAVPDTAVVDESVPASPLADDPVYARGEEPETEEAPDEGERPGADVHPTSALEARS
jgi:sec-independent protein translocase protein TatB